MGDDVNRSADSNDPPDSAEDVQDKENPIVGVQVLEKALHRRSKLVEEILRDLRSFDREF